MHLKVGEFPNPSQMVRKTTCGISFQLTKGGIDDVIGNICQIESFDNNICQMGMKIIVQNYD
jgi:hypothetical protein